MQLADYSAVNSGNPVAEAECLLITAVMDVEGGFSKYLASAFGFILRAVTNVSAVTTCNMPFNPG